ncbi:hypothetical protein FH972_015376 [Carpinus fangiana]|uniref:glutathione transferase n=1 Tax=Carpinus fangiana TaxID=176857 RepID=A0A5N6RD59_9ROSI|nr:hypothetical protein FH972_015376 [Carpinus fangiana]
MEVEAHQFHGPATAILHEIIVNPMYGVASNEQTIEREMEKLGKVLDVYEERLSKYKYLAGERYSLADLHHSPNLVYFMKTTKVEAITCRPHVRAWWDAISSRPATLKVSANMNRVRENIKQWKAHLFRRKPSRTGEESKDTSFFLETHEMRPLDEQETTAVFEKLFKFTGNNLKNIVEQPSHEGSESTPGRYCFRLHKNKVYYVADSLVKRATNIARPQLVSLGTCIGKITHGGSFHLTIQSLTVLAPNAKHKVWLKPTSEMSFLYGNHVLKGGLGRITENIAPGDGVVVFSMSDVPLGFGVAAKSTQDCRKLDPNGIVVLHQADIGGYLRMEDEL